jgi:hypothetical protein
MNGAAIALALTPEQREQLKKATGRDVPAVKIRIEELEARVAPGNWQN